MEGNKLIKFCQKIQWITILIGVLTVALPLVFWSKIPEQIPTHYNGAGAADNWSDKTSLILIFFAVFMVMGIMSVAVYFVKSNMKSQYSSEYEKSEMGMVYPMIVFMNLAVQCMFAYIVFCVVTCRNLGNLFLPIVLVAVFAPIVYFLAKRPKKPVKGDYVEKEKQETGEVYRSKVDWWLGLLLGGSVIWMVYLAVEPIIRAGKVEWGIMLPTILTVGIILPLFSIKYVMYSEHLLVSCGIYGKFRIRYKDITNVKATHNPLSSAALSINRLQIDYVEEGVHGMVLISPVNREAFLEKLEQYRKNE